MFDHHRDALMTGQFRLAIDSTKLTDGTYRATWTAPNGAIITHTDASQAEAHRRVTQTVQAGVLNGTVTLGR